MLYRTRVAKVNFNMAAEVAVVHIGGGAEDCAEDDAGALALVHIGA